MCVCVYVCLHISAVFAFSALLLVSFFHVAPLSFFHVAPLSFSSMRIHRRAMIAMLEQCGIELPELASEVGDANWLKLR